MAITFNGLTFKTQAQADEYFLRKSQSNLTPEQLKQEEFDNMIGDIEEVKYNVKKALGGKYKNT